MALPGGCPGELDEEEEGNAEEGKQGMEEVTCAADRLLELVFNIEICVFVFVFVCLFYSFVFYLQHGGRQTREADGGRDARSGQVRSIRCLRVV